MINLFRDLALVSGRAVMTWHRSEGVDYELKADSSPLSAADLAAHDIICTGLRAAYPDIPLVSEENKNQLDPMNLGDRFFLVDPIDGTKSFIKGKDDFTINIALIEQGKPTTAVLYAPAMSRLFLADDGRATEEKISPDGAISGPVNILKCGAASKKLRILASLSHRDAQTNAFLEDYPHAEIKSVSSSLKFAVMAAGEADLYPRFGPTSAWDTAAGQGILVAAGGVVVEAESRQNLIYGGRETYLNPGFIASVDHGLVKG